MHETERQEIEEQIQELEEKIAELEQGANEDEFKEFLNSSYPSVSICGLEMEQGDILKEMDEIAFREALNNHNDSEITELNSELEDLQEELKDLEDKEQEEAENDSRH